MPISLAIAAVETAFQTFNIYVTFATVKTVAAIVQFIAITAASMAANKLLAPKMAKAK